MNLTDRTIKALKPGEKDQVVWGNGGFGVRVTADGTKTFVLEYRFDEVYKMLELGAYPDTSLDSAKEKAMIAFEKILNKVDPNGDQKTSATVAAPPMVEEKPAKKKSTQKTEPAASAPKTTPAPEPAPAATPPPIPKPPIVTSQPAKKEMPSQMKEELPVEEKVSPSLIGTGGRILSKSEIKIFWNGLANSLMPPRSQMALKMLIATAQRCEEVVLANWADFDLVGKMWNVPASKTLNGKKHLIPLSNFTLDLLRKIKEVSGAGGVLFPGGPGPLLDAKSLDGDLRHAQLRLNMGSFNVADIQQSVISQMLDLKIPEPVVARVVNHPEMDSVEGSENVTDRDIRDALGKWEEILRGLRLS